MTRVSTNSWRRPLAALVLLGFLPLASGCFGSFNLTRKIYEVNKGVSPDKWIRWLVFLAMTVNLLIAGFAGAFIPIVLERSGIDPAIASSIFVTTFTDCFGFFLLLGLAGWFLL